ncbi:MAG: hypothetical protein V7651_01565 [Hyphomonas oceanitis]|uniref:hypothetical protein n=1 Tax=Hyphomonas oceanitis TaxID=81033 RepID=UPI0030013807
MVARTNLVAIAFLALPLLVLAVYALVGLTGGVNSIDASLTDTYYVVQPWQSSMALGLASVGFGVMYLAGKSVAGLRFRPQLICLHLGLWLTGIGLIMAASVAQADISSGLQASSTAVAAGYCVTLLSSLVFAICMAEAIYRRIRQGKEL